MKKILAPILCFAFIHSGNVNAQVISNIKVSNDSIDIGGHVDVYYTLSFADPKVIKHVDFAVFDSIEAFVPPEADTLKPYYAEIDWVAPFSDKKFSKVKINPDFLIKGQRGFEYRDTFQATFWDIGIFPIPNPRVVFDTSYAQQRFIPSQVPYVKVMPPMDIINPDSTSAILPIKDILSEKKNFEDYLWIIYILLGVILFAGLLYYFLKPKKVEIITTETRVIIPSHVEALKSLDALRAKQLWQKGEIKAFQTELTFTIRQYLEKRFKIKALESTTEEISRALKTQNFSVQHENDLREILQIADMVKFAKAKPADEIHESFLDKAKTFVQETSNVEEVERTEIIHSNSENTNEVDE